MNLYEQNIIDRYKNPLHSTVLKNPTHKAVFRNLSCGDEIEIFLEIIDSTITDISHITRGCAISVASADMLCEYLLGRNVEIIQNLNINTIEELLNIKISESRYKCAMLCLEAIRKASSSNIIVL